MSLAMSAPEIDAATLHAIRPSGPRRHLALAAMTALYFSLMAGSFNALGVVLPGMVASLRLSWSDAGFGFTLLGLGCGLTSPLPAAIIRRLGIVATLGLAGVMLVAGFGLFAAAQGRATYDLGAILIGCAFTLGGTVSGTHVVTSLFPGARRPLGLYFGIGGLGSIAGPLVYIATSHVWQGWRPFWWVCAGATGLCALVAALSLRGVPMEDRRGDRAAVGGWPIRAALRTYAFWAIVLGYTGNLAISTTLHGFAVQHFVEHGIAPSVAAGLMSIVALISAISSFAAGEIRRGLGARGLTVLSMAAITLAAVMLAVPESPLTLVVFLLAMGAGVGLCYVASAMMLLDYFGQRGYLELYATMCLFSTSAAAGPLIGGHVHDLTASFRPIFVVFGALGLVLTLGVAFARRPMAVATAPATMRPRA